MIAPVGGATRVSSCRTIGQDRSGYFYKRVASRIIFNKNNENISLPDDKPNASRASLDNASDRPVAKAILESSCRGSCSRMQNVPSTHIRQSEHEADPEIAESPE